MARVVVPAYPHHVTQRGNRRQGVFFGDGDCERYLGLVGSACRDAGTRVLAYCLMPNHVHCVMVPAHEDGLRAATVGGTGARDRLSTRVDRQPRRDVTTKRESNAGDNAYDDSPPTARWRLMTAQVGPAPEDRDR